jgi:hypothetical protein
VFRRRRTQRLGYEGFTESARSVTVLAEEEARQLNHSFLGTEHILLGLIREQQGLAAAVLASFDVSLDAARDKVVEKIGRGETVPTTSPFTPRAVKVFELSVREALQLGHQAVDTEHLLLALLREGVGGGAQVLVSLVADLSLVRQRVIQVLSHHPDREVEWEPSGEPPTRLVSAREWADVVARLTLATQNMRPGVMAAHHPLPPSGPFRIKFEAARRDSAAWEPAVNAVGRSVADYAAAFEALAEWLVERGVSLEGLDPADIAMFAIDEPGQSGFQLGVRRSALGQTDAVEGG